MGLLVLLLLGFVIWLWVKLSRLTERIDHVEHTLLSAVDSIRLLQQQPRVTPQPDERAADESAVSLAPVVVVGVPPVPVPNPPPRADDEEPVPPFEETPQPQPPASWIEPTPLRVMVATAHDASRDGRDMDEAAAPRDSWEMTVGTSWTNKIGVLTLVIGLAYLVGYSFSQIGPAGRVAIGFGLSGALLGVGVWLERRDDFRNYAYGLIAGGWAGIYFTTFAMHEVPAAKVIDSDLLAVSLLSSVAAGMIAHSLRYRSQVVTSLTFVVAYATLALSPLSGFSLAASVPLAMSVLVVSQRFGWPGVSVLGVAATYGVFILRSEIFPGGAMDPYSALPYAALAAYWLTFEVADLIGLRMRRIANPADATVQVSMLALNAAGLLGAIAILSPGTRPELQSTLLFATGAAYIASAVIRAWLLPERRLRADPDKSFDVSHAATAMSALLFAIGIGLRFPETREGLGWLLETQLLFVAGLTLSDRWLRRMASMVAAVVSVHAGVLTLISRADGTVTGLDIGTHTAIAITVAMIWYANRETLRIRSQGTVWLEPAYPWAGLTLLALAAWARLSPAHLGLAGWLMTMVLLEAGLRRDRLYALQSYVAGAFSGYVTLLVFLTPRDQSGFGTFEFWGPAPSSFDDWTVLPVGITVCVVASLRLLAPGRDKPTREARVAAGVAAGLASALTMVFEWRVLPLDAVAPAWALTALALVAVGAWQREGAARWFGYVAVTAAAFRQIGPLLESAPESNSEIAAGAIVIAAMYAAGYVGGRAIDGDKGDGNDANDANNVLAHRSATREGLNDGRDAERAATAILGLAATACFVLFKYRVLPEDLVAPAWALTGLALTALGYYRARGGQRWQGYALALVASVNVADSLLSDISAPAPEAWGAGLVIACVYGTARLARLSAARGQDRVVVGRTLLAIATCLTALLLSRVFGDLSTGPAWTVTGVLLLSLGLWKGVTDLRWHGYAMFAFGALRAGRPVFGETDATSAAIAWLVSCLLAVYVMALASRRVIRRIDRAGTSRESEDLATTALLVGASAMLAGVIVTQARASMVTLVLALQGLGLMSTGLLTRERVLRLSGLTLLLGCLLKLFLYDLRELDPLPRIFSFVVLGLVLLGISWAYTRFRVQIMKLL